MKKVLCYVSLFFLVMIIFTPPLLRLFYKDKEELPLSTDKYAMLSCAKDDYAITSSYKNNQVLNIKFRLLDGDETLDKMTSDNEIEYTLYNGLKNSPNSKMEEGSMDKDGLSVKTLSWTLVFSKANQNTLDNLETARFDLTNQKTYYETAGYICNIIES